MAKIFKVSGYLADVNGDSNVDEVIAEVSSVFDGMINQHIHVEEADIGKWNSESPLNYDNCDLADCEKYFKRKIPVDNDLDVIAGQVYRHFKGQTVKVLHISQDAEAPGQFYVVYECEDGSVWSRPYGMFVSEVDHGKYPDEKQKYRFELVEDAAEKEEFGRWIPCSDRFPEESGRYIVNAIENHIVHVTFAKWMPRMKRWNLSGNRSYWKVTAWMPLPEPYREV